MIPPARRSEFEATTQTVRFFESLLRASTDGIVITDSSQNIIVANEAFCSYFGEKYRDVIETSLFVWLECLDVGAPLLWGELEQRVRNQGHCRDIEFRLAVGEDEFRYLSVNGSLLEQVAGEEFGVIISVWRDTTRRRLAEASLQEAHDKLEMQVEERTAEVTKSNEELLEGNQQVRDLLDSTAEAIYGLDLLGNCTFANPACLSMLGYRKASELIGRNMHNLIHNRRPDGTPYPEEECPIYRAFLSGNGTHDDDEVFWRVDGSAFPVEYWSYPIRRGDKVTGAVVTFLDVSARKKAEEVRDKLLHDSGERIKELRCMYGLAESIRTRDALEQVFKDTVALIPPGWQYPKITRARLYFDDQKYLSRPFEETQWKQVAEIIVGGERRGTIEVFYLEERPELDEGPFLTEERNLLDGMAHALNRAIEHLQAETERKRLRRELQQAQKMESLGQLTGGIAHDFNNILGVIMGFSELARDHYVSEGEAKLISYLDRVLEASGRARDLVAQMMAFTRGNANDDKPLRLGPLVKENLRMMGSMLPSSIQINAEMEENLPSVLMDSGQFNQLLMNLCINARDAMQGRGKLTVRLGWGNGAEMECATCHKQLDGSWVELSVTDTGSGISTDILDRIFDPFFTTKDVGKGTGMGLAVIHGIVRNHGGHILVETEPGKSTTFRLLFPPLVEETAETPEALPFPVDLSRGQGEEILVVDDEPDLGNFIGDLLHHYGYKATVMSDSREALALFRKKPDTFVLAITDQTMPGITGAMLVKGLREVRGDLPVILNTGFSEEIDAIAAAKMGVRYLEKPVRAESLIRAVRDLLRPS